MSDLDARVTQLEKDLKTFASVLTATVDDTLRTNFVLRELESAGYLPTLPWDLASAMVDLHYLRQMQVHGDVPKDNVPIEVKILDLERHIARLRDEFRERAQEQVSEWETSTPDTEAP